MRSPSPEPELNPAERHLLIRLARESIRRGLEGEHGWAPSFDDLSTTLAQPRATFVTLRRQDVLLGCIGSIEPRRPLAHDVAANVEAAAFADPRLPALTVEDFRQMTVKVSVLGPLEQLTVQSFDQIEASVRRGDGILVSYRRSRATFLPSVWEQVPDGDTFLTMLWQKAGLRPREWHQPCSCSATTRSSSVTEP